MMHVSEKEVDRCEMGVGRTTGPCSEATREWNITSTLTLKRNTTELYLTDKNVGRQGRAAVTVDVGIRNAGLSTAMLGEVVARNRIRQGAICCIQK